MPTLRSFCGLESGSIGELAGVLASQYVTIVTNPAPPRPGHTYVAEFSSGSGAEAVTPAWPEADDDHGIPFWIRFTTASPSPNWSFAIIQESKGVNHLQLYLADGGVLRLKDAAGATVADSAAGVLQANVWHLIKILYTHGNPGSAIIYVDRAEIFNVSGQNFDAGGATSNLEFFLDDQGSGGANPCTMYLWANYVRSGMSSMDDFYEDTFEAFGYQNRVASATPDIGQDLDAGTEWAHCGQVPFSDAAYGKYTGVGDKGVVTCHRSDGGAIPGPYGDNRIAGDQYIKGMSCLWRVKAPFLPVGNSIAGHYGKTPHGDPGVDNTATISWGKVTTPAYKLIVSEAAADVPLTSHYAQCGFSGDGAGGSSRNVFLYDAQICILHCPPRSFQLERCMARGVGRGHCRGVF